VKPHPAPAQGRNKKQRKASLLFFHSPMYFIAKSAEKPRPSGRGVNTVVRCVGRLVHKLSGAPLNCMNADSRLQHRTSQRSMSDAFCDASQNAHGEYSPNEQHTLRFPIRAQREWAPFSLCEKEGSAGCSSANLISP
jgi:hypothetical protein